MSQILNLKVKEFYDMFQGVELLGERNIYGTVFLSKLEIYTDDRNGEGWRMYFTIEPKPDPDHIPIYTTSWGGLEHEKAEYDEGTQSIRIYGHRDYCVLKVIGQPNSNWIEV